jgi:peptidyl-prolyl cis-trans isomerase B (cyclophilin B)
MRALSLLLLLVALLVAGCGGDDDEDGEAAPTTTEASATTTAQAGGDGCRSVEPPAPRADGTLSAPSARLDAGRTYRVVVSTNCGDFTVTLDPGASPRTTASIVALVREGFYDGTVFHRIVPGFVIQGGDPTATGRGGPGYQTVDTPAPSTTYTRGIVAMAKGATEAPGTSGSQFFVVTAEDAGLPAEYAVIGEVTAGLDVVARIGALGDPTTEQPTQPVVVESMRVETS